MVDQIVLTAWDGTLLSSAEVGAPNEVGDEMTEEGYGRLRSTLDQLKSLGIPVVVFTQRDRTEVEPIRQQLGLVDPFITESGSAVFVPADHNPFEPALGEKEDDYFVLSLGCPYVQARAVLRVLANEISHPLKGFGDFTVPQLERMAGLSEQAAHHAKAREFSEVFMTPKAVEPAVLQQAAAEMGFKVILRPVEESRFSELLGPDASIGAAAKALLAAYQNQLEESRSLKVTVLSNRAADLAALAEVKNDLAITDWQDVLIEGNGPEAWLTAISPLLTD